MTMTPEQEAHLARLADMERNMLAFAEDWKYIPTLPRGPKGEQAILMLDYLVPDLAHIVAAHYVGKRGWRRHDDLALLKPRRIVGGALEDLVAYVPVDQPDDPIVVEPVPYDPDAPKPDMDQLPWRVKPTVNEIFEERPDDD
jgi:hypothetical protein